MKKIINTITTSSLILIFVLTAYNVNYACPINGTECKRIWCQSTLSFAGCGISTHQLVCSTVKSCPKEDPSIGE